MIRASQLWPLSIGLLLALMWLPREASAARCGSTAAGFETWKRQFAGEAQARGVSATAIAALMTTNYSTATIAADRGQRSFSLSLNQFLAKRGGSTIVARGRALKQSHAALFTSIQQRFGVPPGPLLAIWGMETGFGSSRGNQNVLSAMATLAYDCRRSAYFTDQLYAALTGGARCPFSSYARLDAW
jgi:membrane-bound lytic murein transglycosylase B